MKVTRLLRLRPYLLLILAVGLPSAASWATADRVPPIYAQLLEALAEQCPLEYREGLASTVPLAVPQPPPPQSASALPTHIIFTFVDH